MSLKLGTLYYDITANTSGLRRGEREVTGINKRIESSFNRVGAAIAAAITVESARRVLMLADNMVRLRGRIDAITSSQKESNKVFAETLKIANRVGTTLDGTVQQFQRFAIIKDTIGANNTQILKFSENLQKLGIIAGSTSGEVQATSIQIAQALANNFEAAAQEINSINEQMPTVARAVEENLGLIPGSFKKAVTEGQVTAKQFFNAILEETDKIDAKFAKLPVTIDRAWAILSNNFAVTLNQLDQQYEITEDIAKAIGEFAGTIKTDAIPSIQNMLILIQHIKDEFSILITSAEKGSKQFADWKGSFELMKSAFSFIVDSIITLPGNVTQLVRISVGEFVKLENEAIGLFDSIQAHFLNTIGTISDEETSIRLASIEERVKAQNEAVQSAIDADIKETEELRKQLEERRKLREADRSLPTLNIPERQQPVGLATGGPEQPQEGVSDIDKLRAKLGDETQAILNAHIERQAEITRITQEGSEERRELEAMNNQLFIEETIRSNEVLSNAIDGFSQGMADAMVGAITGVKSFGDAAKQVLAQVAAQILQQIIATEIQKRLFQMVGATAYVQSVTAQGQAGANLAALNAFSSTAAIPIVGPILAPAAAASALAVGQGFALAATTAAAAGMGGGRQFGGTTSGELAHPINESGVPEILNQAGKQYLLPTGKGGTISPLGSAGGMSAANVTVINKGTPTIVDKVDFTESDIKIWIDDATRQTRESMEQSLASGRGSTYNAYAQGSNAPRKLGRG